MVTHNESMRIFWPSDAAKWRSSGVLVGFRNSALDFFVIAILSDVEVCPEGGNSPCTANLDSCGKLKMRWQLGRSCDTAHTAYRNCFNDVGILRSVF